MNGLYLLHYRHNLVWEVRPGTKESQKFEMCPRHKVLYCVQWIRVINFMNGMCLLYSRHIQVPGVWNILIVKIEFHVFITALCLRVTVTCFRVTVLKHRLVMCWTDFHNVSDIFKTMCLDTMETHVPSKHLFCTKTQNVIWMGDWCIALTSLTVMYVDDAKVQRITKIWHYMTVMYENKTKISCQK